LQSKAIYRGFTSTVLFATSFAHLWGQTTAATFGQVIQLGGTPSDIVLDESRARLYLVNSAANRVDVYSYLDKTVIGSIAVGQQPLAAAMSMDKSTLYVSSNGSSTLTIIDLGSGIGNLRQNISLPAKPEGVEVGADGRVLISTQGSGTGNLANTLLIYDGSQTSGQQVIPVAFPPPPPTPSQLPALFARPVTQFRGKLQRTPDGNFIVGMSTVSNNTQTIAYVYEVASGTVLRSRTVNGQSTVLAMSPDGGRFMAGAAMYDTATLSVLAQANTATAPFPITGTFATLQNVGGSTFAPDGSAIYGAFNTQPLTTPPSRPQASTLLISDPKNLGIKLGIKLPESIVAKMVVTADGANAWGMSESGLIYLPLSTLYDNPILVPDSTNVFLAMDNCNRGIARATVKINNAGAGKLTFAVPSTISGGSAALVVQASSGLAPADLTFTMDPGRAQVTRDPGTNLYTGSGTSNNGIAVNVDLVSNEAINVPPTIRVYMNYRQTDQKGVIYPIPTVRNVTTEGLQDLVLDEQRGKLYITNSGYNRVEVFDLQKRKLVDPIPVGPLPHEMAMGLDGSTLYVAHTGGESIGTVDLDAGALVGAVTFPPVPRAGNTNPIAPQSIAMGLSGLQVLMSNGTLWKVVAGQAVPRPASQIINNNASTTQVAIANPTLSQMIGSPDYSSILLLNGNGQTYLYSGLADDFTSTRQLFNAPIQSYYGPLGAAASSAYLLANGYVLNNSLTPIGGAEKPGSTAGTTATGQRNIAAVAPVDENTFVRLTTSVRASLTATTVDDRRTTLESVNVQTGGVQLLGATAENPVTEVFGTTRTQTPPRMMAVDSQGTLYAITISGLTVIPLKALNPPVRPVITGGVRGIVNSDDGSGSFKPGSFVTLNGSGLAWPASADSLPVPTVLGGSCLVFNDVAVPLLQTADGQISAQIPSTVRSGINVVQVRSLATGQQSDPIVVTVGKN
jgi:DNA-binding beta-propeller fold protein YncE